MLNFDEYVTEMEERRAGEKRERFNAELEASLKTRTYEETVAALYAGLVFVVGSGDIRAKEPLRAAF